MHAIYILHQSVMEQEILCHKHCQLEGFYSRGSMERNLVGIEKEHHSMHYMSGNNMIHTS